MKEVSGALIYSPTDLVRYLESPFSSWMDRYHLEHPNELVPDELSEDAELIIKTGEAHEQAILEQFRGAVNDLCEISREGHPLNETRDVFQRRHSVIYQAKLESGVFAGYADFIILDESTDRYQIWDTKLARSPKPYYAIQLCCYSELLADMTGEPMPEKFGLILGADARGISERVEFRTEDFIHYYLHLKKCFLELQAAFNGILTIDLFLTRGPITADGRRTPTAIWMKGIIWFALQVYQLGRSRNSLRQAFAH